MSNFQISNNSIAGGPTIEFAFAGAVCTAELTGARLRAEAIDSERADLVVNDATGERLADVQIRKMPADESITVSVMNIGSALLWSHARWVAAQAGAAAVTVERPARFEKAITFCGQPARVACDGRCSKAWGMSERPRIRLSETDPDDYAWLADDELNDAPVGPETSEGGHHKPRHARGPEDMNKWCVRDCERCVMTEAGAPHAPIQLRDFSRRIYNMQRSDVDATTWRQAGAYKALWVMATATVTVFMVAADATRETLRTWITRVRGVLVTDRGSQFGFWAMPHRQICWAHLIRKFVEFSERTGRAGEIGRELLLWSRLVIHSYHHVRDGTRPRAELQRLTLRLRGTVERLLEEGRDLSIRGVSGSCRDILEHREALWRFVDDPAVEPTNNHAEREVRGLVTWRKSSFGSQSDRGNTFAANLKSVIQTCRKQRRNVLTYLRSAVHAALHNQPAPSLLRPTP